MKKKDDQRLLQFPSVFNMEPGGKAEVKPVEDENAPEWRREVSRKVEEHRKMKELQDNLDILRRIDAPDDAAATMGREKARPDERVAEAVLSAPAPHPAIPVAGGVRDERLRQALQTPKPRESTPRPHLDSDLKEKLADQHRQLFKDAVVEADDDTAESITQPIAFDELDLAKNPTPVIEDEPPVVEAQAAEESVARSEYDRPLGELLSRYAQRSTRPRKEAAPPADRTLLVSRFLAGLIDFVLVTGLAVALLAIVAWLTGGGLFQPRMGALLGGLFVLVHLVYSFYFLFLGGQTPGMAMVGLQVVQDGDRAMSPRAILVRTIIYLLAVACSGIGLIWGIFDREAKCWQDILSDSHVTRVV